MTVHSRPRTSHRCPVCHELMVAPPIGRKAPEYCVLCRAALGPAEPAPVPRVKKRRRTPPADVEALTERIIDLATATDLAPAVAEHLLIETLEEMIAADIDREITDMAGRSEVTREGIILALVRRLEGSAAVMSGPVLH